MMVVVMKMMMMMMIMVDEDVRNDGMIWIVDSGDVMCVCVCVKKR